MRDRLAPTPKSELFFSDVCSSFIELDRLHASAARLRDFGSRTIRIASLAAYGNTVVPRAIRIFRAGHLDIAITFQIAMSAQERELVLNGSVGLARLLVLQGEKLIPKTPDAPVTQTIVENVISRACGLERCVPGRDGRSQAA